MNEYVYSRGGIVKTSWLVVKGIAFIVVETEFSANKHRAVPLKKVTSANYIYNHKEKLKTARFSAAHLQS